jgi:hypothetical protein
MTHHLFVLSNADQGFDVYVLDVDSDYTILGGFDIAGLGDYTQAGLGIDCEGNLWIASQNTNQIIQATSGETGVCDWVEVPWLSATPITGTVLAGEFQDISVTFDAGDLSAGIYQAQLRVDNNNPGGEFFIPVRMNVSPPDYDVSIVPEIDALIGDPGKTVTYYLNVMNTGKYTDSYDIDITSNWVASFSDMVGPLLPGKIQTITVEITIPAGTVAGSSDIATVTLESQSDSSLSASAQLTTTASTTHIIYLRLFHGKR